MKGGDRPESVKFQEAQHSERKRNMLREKEKKTKTARNLNILEGEKG